MLRFLGARQRACDGATRRDVLHAGALAALGLSLPQVLQQAGAARGNAGFGRAKSCLLVYLFGGPSHLEICDMKPDAPIMVRNELKQIPSTLPGCAVC